MLKLSEDAIEQIADDIVGHIRQGKLVKTAEGGGLQTKNKRHQYWLSFMQRAIKNEKELRRLMVKYFKEQEVKALRALGGSKAVNKDVKKVESVPTSKEELKKLAGVLTPSITKTLIAEGNIVLAELNVGISFDVLNPKVIEFIETRVGDAIDTIGSTTKKALRATLKEGVELGESIPKLAKRVADVYEEASLSRAKLIAQTEVHTAQNSATLDAYRQSGVVEKKKWLTAGDERVRDEHIPMDGEEVLLEEPFSNGLMFPSEPRCRCAQTAVLFKE